MYQHVIGHNYVAFVNAEPAVYIPKNNETQSAPTNSLARDSQ